MAAITAAVNRQRKGTAKQRRFLMKASTTIPKGALVSNLTSTGHVDNAADTAGTVVVGVAAENRTSPSGTETTWIQVEYDAEWLFAATSVTQAMLGTSMVVVTNNDVDDIAGATNDIVVGKMTEFVSTSSCWVQIPGLTT